MATITTTSATLDITLLDDESYEFVFKINNPKTDGSVTLSGIRAIYQPLLSAEALYSKKGNAFSSVARAMITQVETRRTDVS